MNFVITQCRYSKITKPCKNALLSETIEIILQIMLLQILEILSVRLSGVSISVASRASDTCIYLWRKTIDIHWYVNLFLM